METESGQKGSPQQLKSLCWTLTSMWPELRRKQRQLPLRSLHCQSTQLELRISGSFRYSQDRSSVVFWGVVQRWRHNLLSEFVRSNCFRFDLGRNVNASPSVSIRSSSLWRHYYTKPSSAPHRLTLLLLIRKKNLNQLENDRKEYKNVRRC